MSDLQPVIGRLRDQGFIAADAAAPSFEGARRFWFVTLLLGLAGWLAGLFLLLFTGIFLDLDSRTAILILGLVLMAAAWMLYNAGRNAVFLEQLALALSIAGQCAVAWGLLEDVTSPLAIAATLLVLQVIVLVAMPNSTARTLAALFALLALIHTVRFAVLPGRDAELFFGGANRSDGAHELLPVAWLLTWPALAALTAWLVRHEAAWMASKLRDHARPLLTGALLTLSVGGMATEPFVLLAFGDSGIGTGFHWQAVFPVLSIALALFAAVCAFRLRSRGMTGFALAAALAHLARFYYLYGVTLLWKSALMAVIGAALLAAGLLLTRRSGTVKEGT